MNDPSRAAAVMRMLVLVGGALLLAGDGGAAAVQRLATPAPSGSGEPRLAAGPPGTLALSWLEERPGGGHRLRWSPWTGRRWATPATIAAGDSFFVNWADFPSVRWLGERRWAAHWLWRTGGDTYSYEVRVSFSDDGGTTWKKPVVPHRDGTLTEHGFVSLVPEAGSVRAVWLDGRDFAGHDEDRQPGPEMTVRTALLGAGGGITAEAELDRRACDCCATAAVATDGGVLVAYRDRSPDEVRDISVVRLGEGGWSEPVPVHADGWKIAGCPVNGPALDAAGNHVAIAWYTGASDSGRVFLAWSSDGGSTFAPPVRIDEGVPLGRVGVALLPDRSAFVTWLEEGKGGASILGRWVTPAGAKGRALTIARTAAARASGFPQVACVGKELFFAWTEPGRSSRVRLARASIESLRLPARR